MYAKFVKALYKYLVQKYHEESFTKLQIAYTMLNSFKGMVNKNLDKGFVKFCNKLIKYAINQDEKGFISHWNTTMPKKFPNTDKWFKKASYSQLKKLYSYTNELFKRQKGEASIKSSIEFYKFEDDKIKEFMHVYTDYPELFDIIKSLNNVILNATSSEQAIKELVDHSIESGFLVEADRVGAKEELKTGYAQKSIDSYIIRMKDFAKRLYQNGTVDQFLEEYGVKVSNTTPTPTTKDKDPKVTTNYTWWFVGGGALLLTIIVIIMIASKKRRRR